MCVWSLTKKHLGAHIDFLNPVRTRNVEKMLASITLNDTDVVDFSRFFVNYNINMHMQAACNPLLVVAWCSYNPQFCIYYLMFIILCMQKSYWWRYLYAQFWYYKFFIFNLTGDRWCQQAEINVHKLDVVWFVQRYRRKRYIILMNSIRKIVFNNLNSKHSKSKNVWMIKKNFSSYNLLS